jgi:GAF domain-containing protein
VINQSEYNRVLAEFARTLVGHYDIAHVLHDLTEQITSVLGISGAGVSLLDGAALRYVTALDERAEHVEQYQEEHQRGPCVEACRSGETVSVGDLRDRPGRWGGFAEFALGHGVRAVAGIPMRVNGYALGALNLYHGEARTWSDDELEVARVLAAIATSYLVNASELERQRRTAEQLQLALDSRIVIEQAKGIIAAERGTTVDEAFKVLRNHARSHGADLRGTAEAVVKFGLRP